MATGTDSRMSTSWAQIVSHLLTSGALTFGDFTLASGRKSSYYIDIKKAVTRPEVLRAIAESFAPFASEYDRIAGVELGAVPLAVAVSLETGLPFLVIRKESKDHGTKRAIEGELRPGDRVVFVEDVVTTGGTLLRAIQGLRDAGGLVDRALSVVDREEGGGEVLRTAGVELTSLVRARDLGTVG